MSKSNTRVHTNGRRNKTKIQASVTNSAKFKQSVSSGRIDEVAIRIDSAELVGGTHTDTLKHTHQNSGKKDGLQQSASSKSEIGIGKSLTRSKSIKVAPLPVSTNKNPPETPKKKMPEKEAYVIEVDEEEEKEETVPTREPYDNLALSLLVFIACFGWPIGVILSCIAKRANDKKNYERSDCFGKIAMYTNILIMGIGLFGYIVIFVVYERSKVD